METSDNLIGKKSLKNNGKAKYLSGAKSPQLCPLVGTQAISKLCYANLQNLQTLMKGDKCSEKEKI
eukprot:9807114-Ditylum_brightwellii.AAC.1